MRKINLLFGILFLFVITILNIHVNDHAIYEELSLKSLTITAQAEAEGVSSCYDSWEYNDGALPGNGYNIVYGERCYENGEECGQNQSCELTSGGTESSCYDLSC